MNAKINNTSWFKLIALLLPLVFLVFVEIILRSFHVGHDLKLFIEQPNNPEYLIFNPNVSRRYFTEEANSTRGYIEPFKKEKEAGTIRIFVQGGSTAYGFPYENNGSFHRMLQYQLNQNYPTKNIEIINLSLTAVNSYTLLDFADEIMEQSPDAVLIYAGHNEYYGALGVGSTSNLGLNPRIVKLGIQFRKLRIGQLLSRILNFSKKGGKPDLSENLMKRMAAEQSIKKGSKIFNRGIAQFEQNVSLLLSKYQKRNIPVFIGSLVSNLKDQPPFSSDSDSTKSAISFFNKAKKLELQQNYSEAHSCYMQAKNYDLLRFRAPAKINLLITRLAEKYNTFFVPVDDVFRNVSENGIVGDELMLEHLHPNLLGYYYLSIAYYNSICSSISNFKDDGFIHPLPYEELPITKVDSLFGVYTNLILRSQWPFNKAMPDIDVTGKSMPEVLAGGLTVKKINWETAMQKLQKYSLETKEYADVLKVAESVALANPQQYNYQIQAAQFSLNLGEYKKACIYYFNAFKIKADVELLVKLIKSGVYAQDFEFLSFVLQTESVEQLNHPMISRMRSGIIQLQTLEKQIIQTENKKDILQNLAKLYYDFGVYSHAEKYTNQLLELDIENEFALQLLKKLQKKS